MKKVLAVMDSSYQHLGLLVIRVGIGGMFIVAHGWSKMIGGPEQWEGIGTNAGFTFLPHLWGFAAAFAETIGALLLAIGLFTRAALLLLLVTMVMAAWFHLGRGDGISGAAHAIEMGIVFLGLFFIGAGKYSIDARLKKSGRE